MFELDKMFDFNRDGKLDSLERAYTVSVHGRYVEGRSQQF
mgnify:CR=1 FL=1